MVGSFMAWVWIIAARVDWFEVFVALRLSMGSGIPWEVPGQGTREWNEIVAGTVSTVEM